MSVLVVVRSGSERAEAAPRKRGLLRVRGLRPALWRSVGAKRGLRRTAASGCRRRRGRRPPAARWRKADRGPNPCYPPRLRLQDDQAVNRVVIGALLRSVSVLISLVKAGSRSGR